MSSKKLIATGGVGGVLLGVALGVASPQITGFEGTKNEPYRDIVGVLTVCTGHTDPDVVVNKIYSNGECQALTVQDAKKAAIGVLKVSPHLAWHPMQLAAAISLAFNVGTGTYATSSVARLFNSGDFYGACQAFTLYKYAGGKVVQGLVNRREAEKKICLSTLSSEGMKNVAPE